MLDTIYTAYNRWLAIPNLPPALKEELLSIADNPVSVEDRFFCNLEFGTGGLRGILGAGTNRMNIFTVARATQGLANILNSQYRGAKHVAIAYDSRKNGRLFAETTAAVLCANDITAHLFPRPQPTPALSWAVRYLNCDAGICITASHNPAQYNGYKVYGADGCQITAEMAHIIQTAINSVDIFEGTSSISYADACRDGMVQNISETVLDAYVETVLQQGLERVAQPAPLKVVYTPLNGTGLECVSRIFASIGVDDVTVVPQQAQPDGNFSTCPSPNPEDLTALRLGLALSDKTGADLLLATDPDCDRVGVAVRSEDGMQVLTGNEVGVLLLDYICKTRILLERMPRYPVAISTIVSSSMAAKVCAKYGVELHQTLTGFKYIGEQIGRLEAAGETQRFIFAFEESCGYLSGSHVRDKDGVNACMLVCQMARHYKSQGQSLLQVLSTIYEEFGFYKNSLSSYTFEGSTGLQAMKTIMATLRRNPPQTINSLTVLRIIDYAQGVEDLPTEDVLKFFLKDECWLAVRPSGTEPKIKFYCAAKGDTDYQATLRLKALEQWANEVTAQC